MQELAHILVALALIASSACRHEIAHAIGAVLAAWVHMIEFLGTERPSQ